MPKSPDLQLIFFRSGPTDWDEASRLQGATDLPLSASGQASLEDTITAALADLDPAPRHVLAAPDEASARCAAAIVEQTGAKLRTIEDLGGLGCGLWEGRLQEELAERSPKAYKQWKQDPTAVSPPEGEGVLDAQHRILSALSRTLEKVSQGPVVIVMRETPINLVRLVIEKRPLAELWTACGETPRAWTVTTTRGALKDHPRPIDASA